MSTDREGLQGMAGIDIDDALRAGVLFGLQAIPEAGGIVATIADLLWPPSGADVWAEIREKVEALIDERLAEQKLDDMRDTLDGLRNVTQDFVAKCKREPTGNPSQSFETAFELYRFHEPAFMDAKYDVLLLPLFAQFATLQLSLLRDAVTSGAHWGMPKADVDHYRVTLTAKIATYTGYVDATFAKHVAALANSTALDQRFRIVNTYVRETTISTLYFRDLWQFMEPGNAVPPGYPAFSDAREIYSDPIGSCHSGLISLPSPPTSPMLGAYVTANDRLEGIEVVYPEGAGPGGVTRRYMGAPGPQSDVIPPEGGRFEVTAENPITNVSGYAGDVIERLSIGFQDGSSRSFATGRNGGHPFWASAANHTVSSIWINGYFPYYGAADSLVVGFRLRPSPAVPPAS